MSNLSEIAGALLAAAGLIWIPGAIVIKAAQHLRARRTVSDGATGTGRLREIR